MSAKKIMTTKELAEYIKLNEKTVLKMAQNRELPGVKIGNQWRFRLDAVDEYLQSDVIGSSREELDTIIDTADHIIPLSRLTEPSLIRMDFEAENIDGVLKALASTAREAGITPDADELFRRLKKREKMLSTAIGSGIAIPHPRHPDEGLFKKPNVVIARSIKGVDFAAPDNKKVFLFFMTCAANVIVHLRLLAKIARIFQNEGVFEKFMGASNENEIMRVLMEQEREKITIGAR